MLQRFSFFLCLVLLPFSGLMSSQSFRDDDAPQSHQRAARAIIRDVIITNCKKEIQNGAYEAYPIPESGVTDENREARDIQIFDKTSEVGLYVRQSYYVDSLNKKIIECLQGGAPDFIGYKTAFNGGKEALKNSGFFLDNNGALCKKTN